MPGSRIIGLLMVVKINNGGDGLYYMACKYLFLQINNRALN